MEKITASILGILSSVVGAILIFKVTQVLKNRGNINLYLKEWKVQKQGKNKLGEVCYIETTKLDDIKVLYIKLEMYNSSEMHKVIRNIKIGFYNNRKEQLSIIPNDKDNRIERQFFTEQQQATIINLEPKKCME